MGRKITYHNGLKINEVLKAEANGTFVREAKIKEIQKVLVERGKTPWAARPIASRFVRIYSK